jgi:predicted glutamine amidotransferase
MCRWAAYTGAPIFLEEIVSRPGHSLIHQSHCATQCHTAINADGFGIAWYGAKPEPGLFRDVLPAWSDPNLKSLTAQVQSHLFLDRYGHQPQQLPPVHARALELHAQRPGRRL